MAFTQPEMHIIGEVSGGSGFGSGVFVKWIVEFGNTWKVLLGDQEGLCSLIFLLQICF
jgi:hypothetical protein